MFRLSMEEAKDLLRLQIVILEQNQHLELHSFRAFSEAMSLLM